MTEPQNMDTELKDVLRPDFLGDVTQLSLDELRDRRSRCQAVETQMSYLRRMVQGHRDITSAELQRRNDGGDPSDLGALVDRLPEILSDRTAAPGPGHLPQVLEPGELSGELPDRLDALLAATDLDGPGSVTDEQLVGLGTQLEALEQEISGLRRKLFERIDTLQDELARRYRTGEVQVGPAPT